MANYANVIDCSIRNGHDDHDTAVKQLNDLDVVYLRNAVDTPTLSRLQKLETEVFDKVEDSLRKNGINYKNQTKPWAFSDVASRSPGRFDIKALPQEFQDDGILKSQNWINVIEAVLGQNYKVAFSGIVESLGGSVDQQWHTRLAWHGAGCCQNVWAR